MPAKFARVDGVCQTLEGLVAYRAGDAILTGAEGEQWPVERANFERSYRPLFDGSMGTDGDYVKMPIDVLAVQVDECMRIPMPAGGKLRAVPGDWLVQYAPGEYGIVADPIFRRTYTIDDDQRSAD